MKEILLPVARMERVIDNGAVRTIEQNTSFYLCFLAATVVKLGQYFKASRL